MSETRLKIFSFNSIKTTADEMEKTVNDFLAQTDIVVEPSDIIVLPDDYTMIYISYIIGAKKLDSKTKIRKRKIR